MLMIERLTKTPLYRPRRPSSTIGYDMHATAPFPEDPLILRKNPASAMYINGGRQAHTGGCDRMTIARKAPPPPFSGIDDIVDRVMASRRRIFHVKEQT